MSNLLCLSAAIGGALLTLSVSAQAQNYPERPIRIVVATPAGSTPDLGARLVGAFVSADLKQPVVIDNRPGVNGTLAAREVLKAAADGYTFLMAPQSTMSITPHVYPKQAGSFLTDFYAVSQIYRTDFSLVVNSASNLHSVNDVIAAAKKSPGKLTAAYAAIGSASHASIELFKQTARVDIYAVPFNGSPAAALGVASGEADLLFESIPSTESVVASGRVRRIAVTGSKRFPLAPAIPTVAESGLPNFAVTTWAGLFASKDVPRDRAEKIASAVARAFANPELVKKLSDAGFLPGDSSLAAFQRFWQSESEVWKTTVAHAPALQQER
ncbi:Bug family tripartite tricarboxylate transporter substrate binding protein [Ottowia thiooxydans]|uniref:Bug family tripartite tricarboxylate transporter substrate binding protein n=1 Tax=Ottowia thiooxydans TaxID=219182 RepID=UPI000419AC05|nr:tripartite tricarboxylate transporter substrate binding protein [Ottowia thiooxydans]